jgi:eukaryotic translation initiation factor 2C
MGTKRGKKGGDQPAKPQQSGTEIEESEAKQVEPSQSQQQQKKKKQQQEPAPPPQLGAVGGSVAGPSQQTEKQKQKGLPRHPQSQHSAEPPSGYVARGFGGDQTQPDKGQAERRPRLPPQQAQPAQEPPPQPSTWKKPKQAEASHEPLSQTSDIQAQSRRPPVAPSPGFAGMKGPVPSQKVAAPQPGVGKTPRREVSKEAVHRTVGDKSDIAATTQSLQTFRIPTRKDQQKCGTKGRRIIVESNHLALDLTRIRNNIVIHYDVTLNPSVPKRMFRAAMEEFRRKHYPGRFPAFDGKKNLYSSGELPFGREIYDDVVVCDDESGREETFNITIKYASQVDLRSLSKYMAGGTSLATPQEAIQAVDIVLRNAAAFRFTQVGRSFFTPPRDQILDLGDGLELWYGFFQSAILGWKPFVNIDVAHKGFPKAKDVVDIIMEVCKVSHGDLQRGLSFLQRTDFLTYIRGLKIDYMLPNVPNSKRTYNVNGVTKSAIEQSFKLDDGRMISVEQYFAREKKIKLMYPRLPCLHVGSLKRPKPIYVPAELCHVTRGQVIDKKMNELQTSNMIKHTSTSTDIRKQKIQQAMRMVGFNDDACVQEFGLSVSDRFENVEARILEAPQLQYNIQVDRRNIAIPMKGVWRPKSFLSSKKLTQWIILNLDKYTREDNLRRFEVEMQKMGRSLGMDIGPALSPHSMPPPTRNTNDLMEFFKAMKNRVQLVVVVIPDRGDCHAKVKQVAELNIGVLTQCVKSRTMSRMNPATCSNILLKVNSKLNGVNHTLAPVSRPKCLQRPVMIVGSDVTHPSPDQTDIPSVAAVSASHDPKAFMYNVRIRLQPPRVEIIEDLENIMKEQLRFFYKSTGYKPERIIFFRDGVSEGQFAQVLNTELTAIRRACSSLDQEFNPSSRFHEAYSRWHLNRLMRFDVYVSSSCRPNF